MKSWLFGGVCASFFVFLCDVASAGAWATSGGFGSISGGRFSSFTPTNGAINGSLSVTGLRTNGDASLHVDAFAEFPIATQLFAGKIDFIAHASPTSPNVGRFVSVGSTQWGSISGTIQEDDYASSTSGAATRSITIFGTFSVGSHPVYAGGPSSMVGSYLTIFFQRAAGGGTVPVFANWSLSTYGATPIPEPASIAIFGAGLLAYALRRRPR